GDPDRAAARDGPRGPRQAPGAVSHRPADRAPHAGNPRQLRGRAGDRARRRDLAAGGRRDRDTAVSRAEDRAGGRQGTRARHQPAGRRVPRVAERARPAAARRALPGRPPVCGRPRRRAHQRRTRHPPPARSPQHRRDRRRQLRHPRDRHDAERAPAHRRRGRRARRDAPGLGLRGAPLRARDVLRRGAGGRRALRRRGEDEARGERALERGRHLRAPVRHRGRGPGAGAPRVGRARGGRGDARHHGAPPGVRRVARARALGPRPRARAPGARRPEPARDPRVPPGRVDLGGMAEGDPVTADRVPSRVDADGRGGLTYRGSRYLLVRPETLVALQKAVEAALGERAPACLVAGGLATGSIYALMALSLVIVYNATRTLNFAQGEMLMVSTFAGWTVYAHVKLPLVVVMLIAVAAAALLGWLIERVIIRHAIAATHFDLLIITLGLSLVLRAAAGLAWTHDEFPFPSFFGTRPIALGPVRLAPVSLGIVGASLTLMLGLWALFTRTRLGRAMRAVAQNQRAARLVGISVERVYAASWVLASVVGAIAGVL